MLLTFYFIFLFFFFHTCFSVVLSVCIISPTFSLFLSLSLSLSPLCQSAELEQDSTPLIEEDKAKSFEQGEDNEAVSSGFCFVIFPKVVASRYRKFKKKKNIYIYIYIYIYNSEYHNIRKMKNFDLDERIKSLWICYSV